METSEAVSSISVSNSNPVRFRFHRAASNFIRAPLMALLEYSGVFHTQTASNSDQEMQQTLIEDPTLDYHGSDARSAEEVSIRIMSGGEEDGWGLGGNRAVEEQSLPVGESTTEGTPRDSGDGAGGNDASGEPSNYRYDIQQVAQWAEQILPFSLLLLVVLIRQHLQGFFGTIWISVVLFKSNDILRKQTALKGERKIYVLIGITLIFMLHVVFVYRWYHNDDLMYPLILLPPKSVPPFWHALFIILVNDTMARQAAMVLKCILLMCYKNTGGHNYRKQGQLLTLVEYMLLLYRTLLPTPVWYRFFLNKEYGSVFSSVTTGLYLTFKLTSIVQKVQMLLAASRALSRKEVNYGSSATTEQVNAAGDLCAICQEKMHAPIMLCCRHIFCEDCVSEWFDRERTCPLCRAVIKAADIRSFADGSTSLLVLLRLETQLRLSNSEAFYDMIPAFISFQQFCGQGD